MRSLLLAFLIAAALPLSRASAAAPVEDEAPAFRSIPVTVVTDEAFRRTSFWIGRAKRVIEEGTADLLDQVDLTFYVDAEARWDTTLTTFPAILDALAERFPHDPGLVVLMLGEAPPDDPDYVGYATLGRPYIVLTLDDAPAMEIAFRHELGHVFGLPHLPGRNVMATRAEDRTRDFDTLSLDVLSATRNIDFRNASPFVGCNLELLQDAYLAWFDQGTGDATLWLNLGIALRREGDPRHARLALEAALRMDNRLVAAWYHLGKARLELNDEEGAMEALNRCLELDPDGRFSMDAKRTLAPLPHNQ